MHQVIRSSSTSCAAAQSRANEPQSTLMGCHNKNYRQRKKWLWTAWSTMDRTGKGGVRHVDRALVHVLMLGSPRMGLSHNASHKAGLGLLPCWVWILSWTLSRPNQGVLSGTRLLRSEDGRKLSCILLYHEIVPHSIHRLLCSFLEDNRER